jgi:hypothetical protein
MSENQSLSVEAHRFNNEVFGLAKEFLAEGADREAIKARAREYEARLPELSARLKDAPPELRPDLNRALADARLDLAYILADGNRPSSTRLHFYLTEQARG